MASGTCRGHRAGKNIVLMPNIRLVGQKHHFPLTLPGLHKTEICVHRLTLPVAGKTLKVV